MTGKDIKTRCVVADLGKMTAIQEYEILANELRDIDIGMLFLNAGWTCVGPIKDLTSSEVEEIVTVNAIHPVYLCKALLN